MPNKERIIKKCMVNKKTKEIHKQIDETMAKQGKTKIKF
jgi:hypothetical protein